jgi:hypothetical protein
MLTLQQGLPSSTTMPVFRGLQRAITKAHEDLSSACDSNLYALRYLSEAAEPQKDVLKELSSQEA